LIDIKENFGNNVNHKIALFKLGERVEYVLLMREFMKKKDEWSVRLKE